MSDTSAPAPPPADAPTSATPSPGDAPAPAAPSPGDAPSPSEAPVPTDPGELSALVTKLHDENIRYKERFRPWEQRVGSLHPQDSAFILDFIDAIYSPDQNRATGAVAQMRAALDQLSPAQQEQVKEAVADAAEHRDDFDPYDPTAIDDRVKQQLESVLAERDEAAAYERAVEQAQRQMADHARDLADQHGIPDFADARTKWGRLLYMTAHNDFPSEQDPMVKLDLAAQAIEEDLRRSGQELLKAKTADASPSPVPADAAEPSGVKKPKDLTDARKAAAARIDKIMAGEVGT